MTDEDEFGGTTGDWCRTCGGGTFGCIDCATDARMQWLQDQLTQDDGIELDHTVLGGYTVDLMEHNGATCWLSVSGATLAEAIDNAMRRRRELRPSP